MNEKLKKIGDQGDTGVNRIMYFIIPFLATGALVAVGAFFLSATGKLPKLTSPLAYAAEKVSVEQAVICAGEMLTFTEIYKVNDAPAIVRVFDQVRNGDTGDVSISDVLPTGIVLLLSQDIGKTFATTIVFSHTATLVVGRYEWRRVSQAAGRDASAYFVLFEVRDCKK